jgi:peroxiredoxin
MKNLHFSIYTNNKLQTVTGQDLFSNKRVLVCSVTRPYEFLTEKYIQKLTDEMPWYKQNGIDEVYLINSADGKLVLSIMQSSWPQLPGLYDHDFNFVKELKTYTNNEESVEFLSRFWNYQVLINNGSVEQFYAQPTRDYIKNLCRDGHIRLVMQLKQWVYGYDENLVIWKPTLRRHEHDWDTFGKFYYYKLCPNKDLKNYLLTG